MVNWINPDAQERLNAAQFELDASAAASNSISKYRHAHLAALRAAGALIATFPSRSRKRSFNAWTQIAAIDEQWQPWAQYFAGGARLRQGIEAGWVTDEQVEPYLDIVEQAHRFVEVVRQSLQESAASHMVAS